MEICKSLMKPLTDIFVFCEFVVSEHEFSSVKRLSHTYFPVHALWPRQQMDVSFETVIPRASLGSPHSGSSSASTRPEDSPHGPKHITNVRSPTGSSLLLLPSSSSAISVHCLHLWGVLFSGVHCLGFNVWFDGNDRLRLIIINMHWQSKRITQTYFRHSVNPFLLVKWGKPQKGNNILLVSWGTFR